MFFVYILRSLKDTKRYVGFTENLERRLDEHDRGLVKSTKNRLPVELIFHETFENKKNAMLREKFFKSGKGREYLRKNNL